MALSAVRPDSPLKATKHIAGIEGTRAIAALSILVYHAWLAAGPSENPVSAGWLSEYVLPNLAVGVTLFFTLSGFLLYRRFAQDILRGEGHPSFRPYFVNRALRILPAYWVALALCGFVLQTVRVDGGVGGLQDDWTLATLSAAFLHFFTPATMLGGIGPAWSLVVEVMFYLTLPLLVLVAVRLSRRAKTRVQRRYAALAPAAILLLIGLSGRVVAFALVRDNSMPSGWSQDWQTVVERGFWGQADLFALGLVVAVISVEVADGALELPRPWRAWAVTAAAAIAVMAAVHLPNEDVQRGQLSHFAYSPVMALACSLLLAAVVVCRPAETQGRLVQALSWRPLFALGLISYSLFLWHLPLIYWMRFHDLTVAGRTGFVANVMVITIVSVAIATLSYLLVERPALARRRRTQQRTALR